MMNTLMTGLGIGLAFWIVIIPALLTSIRRNSIGQAEANKKSLELLEERNKTDEDIRDLIDEIRIEINERLVEIRDALYHSIK